MASADSLVALFTSLSFGLLPHHVTGPDQAVAGGVCPTCEQSSTVIPADLRPEYNYEDSVNGAGDGAIALLIVPLTGAALAALCGHLRLLGRHPAREGVRAPFAQRSPELTTRES